MNEESEFFLNPVRKKKKNPVRKYKVRKIEHRGPRRRGPRPQCGGQCGRAQFLPLLAFIYGHDPESLKNPAP